MCIQLMTAQASRTQIAEVTQVRERTAVKKDVLGVGLDFFQRVDILGCLCLGLLGLLPGEFLLLLLRRLQDQVMAYDISDLSFAAHVFFRMGMALWVLRVLLALWRV